MIEFILNNETVQTGLPAGTTVLDFVRYDQNLKGTKIGCREGDCGACTVLVGELAGDAISYRSMTSCLMPLANAAGKHIVTVEGINPPGGGLTGVQQAMVDESGTQCGFCTVGFVMSLTGFCVDDTAKTGASAVSAVDGNICTSPHVSKGETVDLAISLGIVPEYFADIGDRLAGLTSSNPQSQIPNPKFFVAGGTDLYVQRHDEMVHAPADNLFYNEELRGIRETGEFIEIGASATVTDLLVSPAMQAIFPNLYKHIKLVSSTPIRNMATLAGNFVNASPIGDMTAWFLALNASVIFDNGRELPLRELYLGYKTLAKLDDELVKTIRFRAPVGDFRFNFEKVSKRTCLDIASVNTAISIILSAPSNGDRSAFILEAHASAGGVAPTPLYLKKTSEFLRGKEISDEVISKVLEIVQTEISPISDVRGSEEYKRLLLKQLFTAHFVELFRYEID